jgi:hypothetical protein
VNLDLRLYREIEKDIGSRLEELAAQIVDGKATSFDDYRHRVGRIRGLQDALEVARDANQRVIGVEDKRDRNA